MLAFLKALCFFKALDLVALCREQQGNRDLGCFPDEYSQTKKSPASLEVGICLSQADPPLGQSPEAWFILFCDGFHPLDDWLCLTLSKRHLSTVSSRCGCR